MSAAGTFHCSGSAHQAWSDSADAGAAMAAGRSALSDSVMKRRGLVAGFGEWPLRADLAALELFAAGGQRDERSALALSGSVPVGNALANAREEVALTCPLATRCTSAKDDVVTPQPKMLVVAPLHWPLPRCCARLSKRCCADHDVYITDWRNGGRDVPVSAGRFWLSRIGVDCVTASFRNRPQKPLRSPCASPASPRWWWRRPSWRRTRIRGSAAQP